MIGHPIIVVGEYRDELDGKPISAGAGIDRYVDGAWVPGRYERSSQQRQAYFVYDDKGRERYLPIDRVTMRFRWPMWSS